MGYSENDSDVRVDVFKPSGKWDRTIAVSMANFYHTTFVHDAVEQAIVAAGHTVWVDYSYVCLEPYHINAHPVMLKNRGKKS